MGVNGHIMKHEKNLGKLQFLGMSRSFGNFYTNEKALLHCYAWHDGLIFQSGIRASSPVTWELRVPSSGQHLTSCPYPCPLPKAQICYYGISQISIWDHVTLFLTIHLLSHPFILRESPPWTVMFTGCDECGVFPINAVQWYLPLWLKLARGIEKLERR